MLSYFPQLLFLAPFSATILRITAAIAFLYIANRVFDSRREFAHARFPLVGHAPQWLIAVAAGIAGLVGISLFVGFATQIAAIVGALGALKQAWFSRRYPQLFPLSVGASLLLAAICLSLIFTGAGAFAFDLPL